MLLYARCRDDYLPQMELLDDISAEFSASQIDYFLPPPFRRHDAACCIFLFRLEVAPPAALLRCYDVTLLYFHAATPPR